MMTPMSRLFVILSGLLGHTADAFGAFGAHGLRARFESRPDGVKRLEWWNTAAHYHLVHAVALAFVAWLAHREPGTPSTVAGWCFVAGILLFSGSLYLMALTGQTKLGAITPFGGLLMMAGWTAIVVVGVRLGAG